MHVISDDMDWNLWAWYEKMYGSWLIGWFNIGMRLVCMINLRLVG